MDLNEINVEEKNTIRLEISNLSSFTETKSEITYIKDLPWHVHIKKKFLEDYYLNFIIVCNNENKSNLWSCDAEIEFLLKKCGIQNYVKTYKSKFNYESNNIEFSKFIKWSELISPNNKFIYYGKILIYTKIIVKNVVGIRKKPFYQFTSNQNEFNDGILVIGKTRLYVSKQYLALHSPVFRAMFYSNFHEKKMNEIPIEDVILEEFIEMLNVIYPSRSPITTVSVEYLLELGDKFEINYLINKCENFLLKTNDISIVTKLILADKFYLSDFQNKFLSTFKNAKEIKDLQVSNDYKYLNGRIKAALFDKLINLV